MPKKLATKLIRKSAKELKPATRENLVRLHNAMKRKINTRDIPERHRFQRVTRDAAGRLPPRKSVIRDAVAGQMQRLGLTAYRLWQMARAHYPALSQSAVHEFLKGQRQLELPSVEALLAAVNLQVVRKNTA